MEEKKTFSGWVREHKKTIIITGVGAAAIVEAILVGKNWDSICEIIADIQMSPQSQYPIKIAPIEVAQLEVQKTTISEVNSFIRNLPKGYHASVKKVAKAAENGFQLIDNQTWVEPFTRARTA